ncbi:3,4-dihydroxy-2-butanone-4-phosphate synthase [Prescottella defluvii]|nr:3,4-dihydroxy-2-butanone-4-phosphate synthase [Prescottella defluvii]
MSTVVAKCVEQLDRACQSLAAGLTIVLVDDRVGEAYLAAAAQYVTTESVAYLVRHSSGLVRVALNASACVRMNLPPMWALTGETAGFTVTVDAANSAGTGISAADRACTIRALADPLSGPRDFSRPGHVLPVRVEGGGTIRDARAEEVVVAATRHAGLFPAGVLAELVSEWDPTGIASRREAIDFAAREGLDLLSASDVVSACGWS